jgi:hypothetical protein
MIEHTRSKSKERNKKLTAKAKITKSPVASAQEKRNRRRKTIK